VQLQRIVRAAALAPALAAAESDLASGQPMTFTAAVSKTAYSSGDYGETDGDWRAEGVLRYEFRNRFHAGIGAEIGKLDEPYSDPSFTAAGIFGELGLGRALGIAGRACSPADMAGLTSGSERSPTACGHGDGRRGSSLEWTGRWRRAPRSGCRPRRRTFRFSETRASPALRPGCNGEAGAMRSG